MAKLIWWDKDDVNKPFLDVSPEPTDADESAKVRVTFRPEYGAETRSVDYHLDGDESLAWLLNIAGIVQQVDYLQQISQNARTVLGLAWEPVMWRRTDLLTVIVVRDFMKNSSYCWVHLFLRSNHESDLFHFFVIRPTLAGLRSFGKDLFSELAALPGFDPEVVVDEKNEWNQ